MRAPPTTCSRPSGRGAPERMVAAVTTGAAGDLGQALTEAFLSDGYRVYGGDVVPVEPRAGLVPVHLDVTDRAAVFALAERAAAEADPLKL